MISMHGFAAYLVAAGCLPEVAFHPRVNVDGHSELHIVRNIIESQLKPNVWSCHEKRDVAMKTASHDLVNAEGLGTSRRLAGDTNMARPSAV